jgi:hypothetical protein
MPALLSRLRFVCIRVPASRDEFRARVLGLGRPRRSVAHRHSHSEPFSSKPDTSLAQRTHDTNAPSPPLAAQMDCLVPY